MNLETAKTKTWQELFNYLFTTYEDDEEAVAYLQDEQKRYRSVREPRRWQRTYDLLASMDLYY